MNRRRISEIVGRHIYRLDRGNGPFIGVGDALLQPRQLGAHGRLVAKARRHPAHQSGDLGTSLDESKDIIDEQQYIAMFFVPKMFGHGQGRMANAETGAGGLVHLTEHHDHVGQNSRRLHITIQLLAFAAAFADPAEDADPLVLPDHVVNHLGEQHRLAHTRPAEKARLAAALERHQDIDDFNPRLEDLGFGRSPRKRRRGLVDGTPGQLRGLGQPVDGPAEDIKHARKDSPADRG
ncbi:MAG: hypothetical protein ACD_75C02032G0001 [uncultured bacterium]|nr:MAG: hypothetical protein ACD_75C02032G0001 [uncultured bacterium]